MSTVSGTVTTNVTIGQTGYTSPLTIATGGTVDIVTGYAIYSRNPATVVDLGTVEATGGNGIELNKGGRVDNSGLIEGLATGVYITSRAGAVTNSGTVVGPIGSGILLGDGGIVTNTGLVEGVIGIDVTGDTAATVVNQGTIKGGGATSMAFASASDVLVVSRQSVFEDGTVLGGGGTLELAGPKLGALSGLGTVFKFFGTIRVDPKAVWTLSGDASGSALFNDGKIIVAKTGSLVSGAVDEDAARHGTIDIATGGQAEFKSNVDAEQSLLFTGQRGFLMLDDPAKFAATISGFKKGDTIDLAGIAADKVSFSKGKLAITDVGHPVATLSLKGHYTTKEFVVTNKGSDTWITIGKPTAAAAPGFIYAEPGTAGAANPGAHEAAVGGGGGGRIDGFVPFGGGAAGPAAGVPDAGAPLPWAADPFHFWTIQD
jgi:hypothetical protein